MGNFIDRIKHHIGVRHCEFTELHRDIALRVCAPPVESPAFFTGNSGKLMQILFKSSFILKAYIVKSRSRIQGQPITFIIGYMSAAGIERKSIINIFIVCFELNVTNYSQRYSAIYLASVKQLSIACIGIIKFNKSPTDKPLSASGIIFQQIRLPFYGIHLLGDR